MFLSVVIPVYKEARNIEEFLRRMVPLLEPVTSQFELIFAMDPSPDDTEAVLVRANINDQQVAY